VAATEVLAHAAPVGVDTDNPGMDSGEPDARGGNVGGGIDKSVLALALPRRYRDREHLRHVAQQPCLVCGRNPSDPHHLRFVQPRALGRKSSDEYAVPLCRIHHRLVHRVGNEAAWWAEAGIDPVKVASKLWKHTRSGGGRMKPEPAVQPVVSDQTEAPNARAVDRPPLA
jgi:hypothetical protein